MQELQDKNVLAYVIVYIIWFLWLMNQIIVLVVLLNFVIALISEAYENVMSKEQVHTYMNKC